MPELIDAGINGPFVRSGWAATPEPQSAKVYAERVTYDNGDVEFWSVQGEPFAEDRFEKDRRQAPRWKQDGRRVVAFDQVCRVVTISATPWVEGLEKWSGHTESTQWDAEV